MELPETAKHCADHVSTHASSQSQADIFPSEAQTDDQNRWNDMAEHLLPLICMSQCIKIDLIFPNPLVLRNQSSCLRIRFI